MTDRDDRYLQIDAETGARLKHHIAERMRAEPDLIQAELVRRSGVSHPTVRSLMRGEPGRRSRRELRLIASGLGWTPDSIESVVEGGQPLLAAEPQPDALAELRTEMRRRDADLQQQIDELRSIVEGTSPIKLSADRPPLRLAAHEADVDEQEVGPLSTRPRGVPLEPEGP